MEEEKEFRTVRGYQLLGRNQRLITPAMEDYLEMIYRHMLAEDYIRINTLSGLLNVSPPSATKMVQKLARFGLIHYRKYGIISLTETGLTIGEYLLHRHVVLETFLKNLGVTRNLLIETELIEHSISPNSLHRLDLLNAFLAENPEIAQKLQAFLDGRTDEPPPV